MPERFQKPRNISLRPAAAGDYAFAEALYLSSTGPLLSALGRWDEAAARERLSASYPRHPAYVIGCDGQEIGWLQVSEGENGIHIHQMHLVPRYRDQGIGSRLIRDLLSRAQKRRIPISLNVIRGNRAISLYLRLGFRVFEEDAELIRMRWNPAVPEKAA
jgi:ribosomal protein S18 acetylase RimI-like enzyme